MDPLSQGLLGAALAVSCATKKDKVRLAAICGALGGMAPDLDVFIRSATDSLLGIEYHRHFTHALAFVPFGGLLVTAFIYSTFKKDNSFKTVYIFTTLGFFTHGLLDASTSYGTRLYWPFLDIRVSWNIISIIDPIFTFTLLCFLIFSLIRKTQTFMRIGLSLAMLYLSFAIMQYNKVQAYITNVATARGHKVERLLLNPTIGNNILWRTVYKWQDNHYVNAVYMPVTGQPILHPGPKVPVIDKETVFAQLEADSVQRNDIRRFAYFSQDYIYIHPIYRHVIGDLRYGTLPNDIMTLWGLEIDVENPNQHANFTSLRNMENRDREEFILMLNGNK